MKIGITCYPTYGGSGAVATELGLELARRGHEVHFITYASPFRLRGGFAERVYYHEVETRHGHYPLFDHFPFTLALASHQYEVSRREKLDLLHVHYAIPYATTAWIAREMLRKEHPIKVVTTLHGTDITLVGTGVEFLRHHQVFDRALGRGDRGIGVPAERDPSCLRPSARQSPCHPELREPRRVSPRGRAEPRWAGTRRAQDHQPHLQLPRGEAGQGRDPDLLPDQACHAGHPAHDRRRPGARRSGARGGDTRGVGPRPVPGSAGPGGGTDAGDGLVPAPLAVGVVRPRGARGDVLRLPGRGEPGRRASRRSSRTASTASSSRWARSRRWAAVPWSCCAIPPGTAR